MPFTRKFHGIMNLEQQYYKDLGGSAYETDVYWC